MAAANPPPSAARQHPQRWWAGGWAAAAFGIAVFAANGHAEAPAGAKPIRANTTPATTTPVPTATASGEQWPELTPAQRQFLQPLERDWPKLDPQQRRKWLVLSARAPAMSAPERQRIQARMTAWATLTPEQRGQARLRYQEARQLPAGDRQARWNAYQSLPPEQKQQLAARAALPAAASGPAAANAGARPERPASSSPREPVVKSNLVPNPALAARPKPIGPALVQARPGATTTLITKRATPPIHQQTGMPKIAATPEFVDKATLLPQRGPQATVAGRSPAASDAGAASPR